MKRLYLLLLVVFALFISLTSVSYAYTIDDVLSYSYQLKDKTSTNGGGTCAYDFLYTKLTQYWTSINNTINTNASDCTYFIVGCQYAYSNYNDYSNFVYIHCFTNSPPLTHSGYLSGTTTYEKVTFSTNSNYYKGTLRIRASNGSSSWYNESTNYICADININPPKGFFLIADGDYSSYINYNINGLIPPYTGPEFTVSTFNTTTIPIFANGQTENFQKLQFTTQMRLKDLGNISNFAEVYAIKGNFGPYVTYDIIDGSQSEFYYNKFGGTQNGSLVFYSDTGLVQIRTSKLIPKQGYNLNLAYQTEKNGEWTDFADVNFYALYYGDLSSSGDLVSPDLNSTVDVGFVRALDEFFNPTSGEISEASESIFQNPFGSGEFFGITYTDYDDWGFGDFVIGLFEGIYNIFNDFTDVSISFGMLGTISSEAFTTTGSVHSFLAIFTDAIFIIMMVFWYFRLVRAFSTFDLTAISKYDFDQMFNMF